MCASRARGYTDKTPKLNSACMMYVSAIHAHTVVKMILMIICIVPNTTNKHAFYHFLIPTISVCQAPIRYAKKKPSIIEPKVWLRIGVVGTLYILFLYMKMEMVIMILSPSSRLLDRSNPFPFPVRIRYDPLLLLGLCKRELLHTSSTSSDHQVDNV
jgi:hypothetical protein